MATDSWAAVAVIAAAVSATAFQRKRIDVVQTFPRFEDFPIRATANFKGTPATPQLNTPGQKRFRTMLRQATISGPNFAGHYSLAEWGCGTDCKQIAAVDTKSGHVYDSPFGILPAGVIYVGPNMEEGKAGVFYRLNSSLLIVVGCPNYKNCGSYYYDWNGAAFTLLRQASMKPLHGSGEHQVSSIKDIHCTDDGNVHIVYSDGTEFQPPRETGQVSCSSPAVAESNLAAGWLVEMVVCCQSYAIPTTLVVYRPHKPLRRFASGTLVLSWIFLKGGSQVAYYSDRSHGPSAPFYGLFDVETERLIDKWEGELTEKAPAWAQSL